MLQEVSGGTYFSIGGDARATRRPHHLNIWLCIYSTAVGRLSTDVKQNTRKYMHNTLSTKELRPYQPEEILATSVPCMAVPKTRSACR